MQFLDLIPLCTAPLSCLPMRLSRCWSLVTLYEAFWGSWWQNKISQTGGLFDFGSGRYLQILTCRYINLLYVIFVKANKACNLEINVCEFTNLWVQKDIQQLLKYDAHYVHLSSIPSALECTLIIRHCQTRSRGMEKSVPYLTREWPDTQQPLKPNYGEIGTHPWA